MGSLILFIQAIIPPLLFPPFPFPPHTHKTTSCLLSTQVVNFDAIPRQTTIRFENVGPLQSTDELLVLTSANAYDTAHWNDAVPRVFPTLLRVSVAASTQLTLDPYSLSILTVGLL